MKRSDSIVNLAAALCKFQGMVKNPPKTKTATIPTSKGTYTYKYADLGVIRDSIAEPLAKCGLAWVQQPVEENGVTKGVKTIVFHESGEWIEFEPVYISAGANASPQQVGSALTYARRYSLCLALGIVADEDDDAQAAQSPNGNGSAPAGKPQNRKQEKAPTKPEPAPAKAEAQQDQGEAVPFQQRRFFAIIGKRRLTDKQCKALVFGFTGKRSRKDVTEDEFQALADWLEKASAGDIKRVIDEAAAAYLDQAQEKAQQPKRGQTEPITNDEIDELLGKAGGDA